MTPLMGLESNYYARLGIPVNASMDELRHAYRQAARLLHPDTNVEPGATEVFLTIQEAYDVISDPVKRAAYDASLPAEVFAPPPVRVGVLYSRAKILQGKEPQLIYTLVELKSLSDADTSSRESLNICLVLDCSTSMQGEVMDTLKATSIELVRQIRSTDSLSIVSFNDRAQVLIPAGVRMDRGKVETSIRMLKPSGGTEIYQGLNSGYNEMLRIKRQGCINHMILVTDGHTYGDEAACLELARDAQLQQIGISALGIGNKWNDEFLDSLTTLTGGTSFYVKKPEDIRRFLKDKVIGLGQSFADQVVFKYENVTNVNLRYAFRLQPEAAPLEIGPQISLGSIPREERLLVLFEFYVTDISPENADVILADGRINFSIPGRSPIPYSLPTRLERPTSLEPDADPPPNVIMQALSKLTLYRMQEKARLEAEAGNIEAATSRLQFLATNLLANGEKELARTAMREAVNIQSMRGLSEEGKKQIKYGTRSLMPLISSIASDDVWENGENEQGVRGDKV
jgi:Ca-activated chloride channel family protein